MYIINTIEQQHNNLKFSRLIKHDFLPWDQEETNSGSELRWLYTFANDTCDSYKITKFLIKNFQILN